MLARVARIGGGAVLVSGGAIGSIAAGALGEDSQRSAILMLMQLDDKLRPTLAATLPAEAFICLYSATRTPFAKAMGATAGTKPASPPAVSAESVRVMGLSFRNDLGNAAGLDKDGSLLEFNYAIGAGYTVVGTVLSEPHTGNIFSFIGGLWKGNAWTPLPLSGGALNSLGLPSQGVAAAMSKYGQRA